MALTVDMILDKMSFGRFNCKVMFIIGMIWMMEGIEVTLMSLVAPRLQCEWKLSSFQTSVTSSAVFVGMGVGAAYWGWLADRHGRKVMILVSSISILYFGMLTSVAINFLWFVLIRFFVGIGVGGISIAICYLVEFSTTAYRAKMVIATQFFFAFGNVFAAMISYLTMNTLGWRVFVILCALPIPFVIALVQWLPESVRYLQNTGNFDSIMKVFHFISKENNIPAPKTLNIECMVSSDRGKYKALLNKTYCRELIVLVILWIVAWWSYYGVVLLNTKIIQNGIYSAGNTTTVCYVLTDEDYLQNIIVVFGEFPGLIFFILVIEKFGRKKSLMLSFFSTGICLFILAFPLTSRVSTVVMFLTRATSTTLSQILYVYTSEIFPTIVRNTALGFCIGIARCFLAILPFIVNILIKSSFISLIALLSTSTLLCSLLCLLLPETTGRYLLNR